jgi:WD40 repeat protein
MGGLDACSTVNLQEGAVRAIAVSRDCQVLASLVARDGFQAKVCFWDLAQEQPRGQWSLQPWFPRKDVTLSFHSSNDLLAASGDGELLFLLHPSRSEVSGHLDVNTAKSFVFGAQGNVVYGIRQGDEVVGWDASSMKEVYHWSNRLAATFTGRSALNSLAVGKNWLVAGSETVGAAMLPLGGEVAGIRWQNPGSPITAVAICSDDSLAAIGTQTGTIRVVRVGDGRVLAEGRSHADRVQSLSFSEDGTLLASASHDGTVCLWHFRLDSGGPIVTLSFESRPVDAVCFAQQDKSLAVLLREERAVRLVHLERLRADLAALGLNWLEDMAMVGDNLRD